MKRKCQSCGKTYDYDKYDGFCPYCGMYMAQKTEGDILKEKITPDVVKKKKRMTVIFVIALVFVLVLPFIGYPVITASIRHQVKQESPGYLEPMEWSVGETVTVGGAELLIETVNWDPEVDAKAIKGHRILQFRYAIQGAESLEDNTEVLLCVDGEYILPFPMDGYTQELEETESNLGFVVPEDAEQVTLVVSEYNEEVLTNRYALEVEVA